MTRRASRLISVALLALAILPAAASAQISGQGSSLAAPANYPYHCETRWMPGVPGNPGGFGPGGVQDYVEQPIGPSTCTVYQLGSTAQTSHLVPNSGTVTVARVKSGPNPAPVSIATVRQYTGKRPSDGQLLTTCCQGISETPTVNLTPNGITEIPVNFLVLSKPYDPNNPGVAGYRDLVVVNVHGTTGTLPISDAGLPRPIIAPPGDPNATWHFPQIDPNQTNQNAWIASRFEVLMNYDWVPQTAAPEAPAAPTNPAACPASAGLRLMCVVPGAAAPVLAEIRSRTVRLKRGRIGVSVKCTRTDGKQCTGRVRLRTSAKKKPALLASARLKVAAGKSKTVSVRLSAKARKRIRKAKKLRVDVAMTGQPVLSRTVTLKR